MTYGDLLDLLQSEHQSFEKSLKDILQRDRSLRNLQRLINETQGKIRQAQLPLTADSPITSEERSKELTITDETYANLQRSLNRQKKILSIYRKNQKRSS